jgi:hypothetical protein
MQLTDTGVAVLMAAVNPNISQLLHYALGKGFPGANVVIMLVTILRQECWLKEWQFWIKMLQFMHNNK